ISHLSRCPGARLRDEGNRRMDAQRSPEQPVQEPEARLRLLVEQMPAIVWTTDSELRMTSASGAGLAALRIDPSGVAGISVLHFLNITSPESTAMAAHRQALGGGLVSFEVTWRGRAFQVHVEPLHGPAATV